MDVFFVEEIGVIVFIGIDMILFNEVVDGYLEFKFFRLLMEIRLDDVFNSIFIGVFLLELIRIVF